MVIDDLAVKEILYHILTKDAILTEAMDAYIKSMITLYDESLLHSILCMYIYSSERNDINKEKDIFINEIQFTMANKRVDSFIEEWQNYVNSTRFRYGKRYDLVRDRFSCYLAALYIGKDANSEYQSFINDIINILGITPKNQLWGYRPRVRNIFNKLINKRKKQ